VSIDSVFAGDPPYFGKFLLKLSSDVMFFVVHVLQNECTGSGGSDPVRFNSAV
jgi:hypothetical protein